MALQREAVTWAPVNFKGKCNSQTFPKSKQTLCHILHFITEEIFSFLCRSHSRSDSTHSCMWMYSTSRGTYSTKTIGNSLVWNQSKAAVTNGMSWCLETWVTPLTQPFVLHTKGRSLFWPNVFRITAAHWLCTTSACLWCPSNVTAIVWLIKRSRSITTDRNSIHTRISQSNSTKRSSFYTVEQRARQQT